MQAQKKRKMKSLFKLFFVVCFFNSSSLGAQLSLPACDLSEFSSLSLNVYPPFFHSGQVLFNKPFLYKNDFPDFGSDKISIMSVPNVYSYHDLAFFCKMEVKIEKAARFPVKLRLGDVNYVNLLEGK